MAVSLFLKQIPRVLLERVCPYELLLSYSLPCVQAYSIPQLMHTMCFKIQQSSN